MLTTRTKRPAMSPSDAKSFKTFSVNNAAEITSALALRGCSCQPYKDVFTFNRWKALGRHVKKGEHGIRLSVMTETEQEDRETGEVKTRKVMHRAYVFCACQVEE